MNFSFNIGDLESKLHVDKNIDRTEVKKIPFNTNEKKFTKLAFDMFQSKYDSTIWELAKEKDGSFLVKRTDLDDVCLEVKSDAEDIPTVHKQSNLWTASSDHGQPVILSFMSVPVKAFDPTEFGYDKKTSELFADSVLSVINSDINIAKKYIKAMERNKKEILTNRCSERLVVDEIRQMYSWLVDAV